MKRNLILYILGVLIFILSIIGLTYAFMRPKVEEKQESTNISISSCAKVQLKDNGKVINLENTYPMDNDMGLETNPYEFTISSTCEDYVGFNLYLTSLSDNQIADNNIHFAITSKSKIVLSEGILGSQEKGDKDFNTKELKELNAGIKGTAKNIYKVYSNNIPFQGESTYQLYLWVDKDASNETMGKSFKIGVSVKSYNRNESYADICNKSLATCKIAQRIYETSTLIYHDTNLKNGAEDLSYRFSGASDVVNNYVCLDEKTEGICTSEEDLYRIIGLFKNEQESYEIKLIKASIGTTKELGDEKAKISEEDSTSSAYASGIYYYWNNSNGNNSTNMWQYSNLNKVNLNSFFYNYITTRATYLENHITEHIWATGGTNNISNAKEIYDSELGNGKVKVDDEVCYDQGNRSTTRACTEKDIEYPAHIGLMYISDYMYATTSDNWTIIASNYVQEKVKKNNWLNINLHEWTISRHFNGVRFVTNGGHAGYCDQVFTLYGVRPSFYITPDAKISEGEGSKMKPYRLTFD